VKRFLGLVQTGNSGQQKDQVGYLFHLRQKIRTKI